jgi:hypothetical protein
LTLQKTARAEALSAADDAENNLVLEAGLRSAKMLRDQLFPDTNNACQPQAAVRKLIFAAVSICSIK